MSPDAICCGQSPHTANHRTAETFRAFQPVLLSNTTRGKGGREAMPFAQQGNDIVMGTFGIEEHTWYAVRTLHCKEQVVADYFTRIGMDCFIPMLNREVMGAGHKPVVRQVPAIHNLLFVRYDDKVSCLSDLCRACPVPSWLVRLPGLPVPSPISGREMSEFRAVCDPSYRGTLYVTAALAEAKPGQPVRVVHGHFAGLRGKLVRHKGRYYVVIVLSTVGVMVHIPRWYCEAAGEDKNP